MQPNKEDQAIKSALDGNWPLSIELNQQILKDSPDNIPALNRLAKAFAQTGETDQAITTYEHVLKLDKFNTIAQKKCALLRKSPLPLNGNVKITTTDFVEEPGKTKTTALVRLGDSKILSTLQSGQSVNLLVKTHWIAVTTEKNYYVGSLADNVSFKLKQLIAGGNQFQAIVRTASSNQVSIFIRELHRAPQFANSPSF